LKNNVTLIYSSFFAFGLILGAYLVPNIILEIGYLIISIVVISLIYKNKILKSLNFMVYLMLLEPIARLNFTTFPYLYLQYLVIFISLISYLNGTKYYNQNKLWLWCFIITILFELFNTSRTIDTKFTRSTIVNSLALFSFILMGIKTRFNEADLRKLLINLSFAGFLLTGFVASIHFQGNIEYTNIESNSESSNGLGPVQLSFYLSFTILATYFLYLYFNTTKSYLYVIIIAIQTIVMILTFSRGGLYFLAVIFLIVNIDFIAKKGVKLRTFLGLILFIPIGIYIYNFSVSYTQGAVIDRYSEEGTSNRDVLVENGIKMFKDNPIFGLGTGNFPITASYPQYFGEITGAHNEFVRILAEHGILCFIFYILFWIFLFLDFWNTKTRIVYFIIPLSMILAFNFGSIHNGLKLCLQSFAVFVAIAYSNSSMLKPETVGSN
jgi:O-antigen ligase